MKTKVQIYNKIAKIGLSCFPEAYYDYSNDSNDPDIILLRSHDLHDEAIPDSVKAIGRAGAGTNNIPVESLTENGIPVFNTPGANANAVKELVIASMIIAARNICPAWAFASDLKGSQEELNTQAELGKKQFSGTELIGKTLGVIGLGAIGLEVANSALGLGMNVIGYDPVITVEQAWRLDTRVTRKEKLETLLQEADYVTVHVPLNEKTKKLLSTDKIKCMPQGATLLNFARAGIVDSNAVLSALNNNQLKAYINDFPTKELLSHEKNISLPHLGASTHQAEENCAVMIVRQIRDYLETGQITHSVNFPDVTMPWTSGTRLAIVNRNIPNMVGQISTLFGEHNINVIDLINKSKGEIAYTLIDIESSLNEALMQTLKNIDGIISVRKITRQN